MQLKNDIDGRNGLRQTILKHYEEKSTPATIFRESEERCPFFIDRKHVARYGVVEDKSTTIGGGYNSQLAHITFHQKTSATIRVRSFQRMRAMMRL